MLAGVGKHSPPLASMSAQREALAAITPWRERHLRPAIKLLFDLRCARIAPASIPSVALQSSHSSSMPWST
jgi:hypothetical protein